jgi:2-methylisocitrate lyase-like PEP mutase family enzyme
MPFLRRFCQEVYPSPSAVSTTGGGDHEAAGDAASKAGGIPGVCDKLPGMPTSDFTARRAAFRKLHESGCFVIPNPWDIGTARYLRHLGFPALATTSAGFAFSRGLPDADWAVPRDSVLQHIREIAGAVELPVNADFESGYAHEPDGVAENVRLCIATGVAGLSIEDATGDPHRPLYELSVSVERIRAARVAIDASRSGVLLTGRAECFLVGHPDPLRESIRRLQAYSEAGADVLYAPGPRSREDIQAIVSAVHPKPVNVLMSAHTGLRVPDLAGMGVRRISVGSSLARAAWTAFMAAAREIAAQGSFARFDGMTPYSEINALFREDWKQHEKAG